MSHLIIEQGTEVGKEITVPASGMKFGRSPANDLVLDDEVLMLFQGRFFFKSDGTLWATDFSVGEKSHIGGVPIVEQQLKMGDLVEVGSTAFRVINTRQEQEEAAAPEAAVVPEPVEAADEEIDLGFKPEQKTDGRAGRSGEQDKHHSSPIFRVLQVAVVVLVLLLLVVGATEFMRSRKGSGNGVRMQGIFLNYERVRGDGVNIFRYAVTLTPDGMATLQADDVHSRHFTRSAKLDEETLARLKRRIAGSGFFKIMDDRVGKADGLYNLYDMALGCDGEFNHVRVLNREVPADLSALLDTVREVLFDAMDVSHTLLIDDAELIRYAKESYRIAQNFYREREASYDNLYRCIKQLQESLTYLETLNPKPEPYEAVNELLSRVKAEQSDRYKEYMFLVDKAMRISDWNDARRNLQICAQLISDRSDERYETIAAKMIEVEDKLR